MNNVSTKLFKLDLAYFKNNFLNQKTWGQKHLLYENSTIRVEIENHVIDTSNKKLGFSVKVKIVDKKYFKEKFDNNGGGWDDNSSSSFYIPIDHEEYTPEVFVKKVFEAFKSAYKDVLYWYKDEMPIQKEFKKHLDDIYKKLVKEGKTIYKSSKADVLKEYITEERFVSYYVNDNKKYKEQSSLKYKLETNSREVLMEKDVKLFCDILGLDYTPAEEIERYQNAEEEVKGCLK